MQYYMTLVRIKAIIHNQDLDDDSCFMRIEEILDALEDIGSSVGNRHDDG